MSPEQLAVLIADEACLERNDDGTYTAYEGHRTFLVEIKVSDVTDA